jgi:hypothetical protein
VSLAVEEHRQVCPLVGRIAGHEIGHGTLACAVEPPDQIVRDGLIVVQWRGSKHLHESLFHDGPSSIGDSALFGARINDVLIPR